MEMLEIFLVSIIYAWGIFAGKMLPPFYNKEKNNLLNCTLYACGMGALWFMLFVILDKLS